MYGLYGDILNIYRNVCVYTYIYTHVCIDVCIYIYLYNIHMYAYTCIHTFYVYIYIKYINLRLPWEAENYSDGHQLGPVFDFIVVNPRINHQK